MGAGGKSVDGALGFFRHGEPGRVLVPIELKPVRQDLDRSGGRALTPVQQAWDYANHSPGCKFVIVSNYKETRLYSTARTPDVCETFLLEDLATIEQFKRFYYLLARERLLGPAPDVRSPVETLLDSSAKAEREVTNQLYVEYRDLREKLFAQLKKSHSNLPALEVLGYAQTILDRVLFVAFAEDRGLLPRRHSRKRSPTATCTNLRPSGRTSRPSSAGSMQVIPTSDSRHTMGGSSSSSTRSNIWRSPTSCATSWGSSGDTTSGRTSRSRCWGISSSNRSATSKRYVAGPRGLCPMPRRPRNGTTRASTIRRPILPGTSSTAPWAGRSPNDGRPSSTGSRLKRRRPRRNRSPPRLRRGKLTATS